MDVRRVGKSHTGADNGPSQPLDDSQADFIVRHSYTRRFSRGKHELRHEPRSLQYKGIGPRERPFHDPVGIIGNLCIEAYILQVSTDKGEGLCQRPFLELVYTPNGPFVKEIASNAVKGIRGIDDETTLIQYLNDLFDEPLLRIIRIDG